MTHRATQLLAAVVLSAAGMWTAAGLVVRWLFRTEISRGES